MSKKQKEPQPSLTVAPVNLYLPGFSLSEIGYLVGYRFESTHLVISTIVSQELAGSLENLSRILKATLKLQAFNKYCASEPQILGIIESSKGEIIQNGDLANFKKSQSNWLHIKTSSNSVQTVEISSGRQVHIVFYPKMREGEFISLSQMNFGEVIDQSKSWDKKGPYLQTSELLIREDLTENDLAIRQINVSKILHRLLNHKLARNTPQNAPFTFEEDFYGRQHNWFRIAFPLKLITLIYIILYIPYRISIAVLSVFSPLDKLNTMLQIQKKKKSFRRCKQYIDILDEKIQFYLSLFKYNYVLKVGAVGSEQQYFDHHFYKMSIYSKLQSLITSMVCDVLIGIFLLFLIKTILQFEEKCLVPLIILIILLNSLIHYYTHEILEILHYFGKFLHIEVLERQVNYLMNLPAGFKPNPNLDNFLGNLMLDVVSVWNYVTTELTGVEVNIARYFGLFGILGINNIIDLVQKNIAKYVVKEEELQLRHSTKTSLHNQVLRSLPLSAILIQMHWISSELRSQADQGEVRTPKLKILQRPKATAATGREPVSSLRCARTGREAYLVPPEKYAQTYLTLIIFPANI